MVVEADTEHLVCASSGSWAHPDGAVWRHFTNSCLSNWSVDSGTKSKLLVEWGSPAPQVSCSATLPTWLHSWVPMELL